jgi:hypothetical protein
VHAHQRQLLVAGQGFRGDRGDEVPLLHGGALAVGAVRRLADVPELLGVLDVGLGIASDSAGEQLAHDGVAAVLLGGSRQGLADGIVLGLAGKAVQAGLVALEAEQLPAAELGHERGVLTGAEARVARDDPELPAELVADPGEQLAEGGCLALLRADGLLPDAGTD